MSYQELPNRQDMLNNLRSALQTTSDECELYETMLMELAEFEAHGGFGEDEPRFQAALAHLEACSARCNEEYAMLVQSWQGFKSAQLALPQVQFPQFFAAITMPTSAPTAIRQQHSLLLKMWDGLKRTLDLQLPGINLQPKIAVMADTTLFTSEITELTNQPFFIVSAKTADHSSLLQVTVALSDVEPVSRWVIQLTVGSLSFTQTTNEHGIAEFDQIPVAELATSIRIICDELTT